MLHRRCFLRHGFVFAKHSPHCFGTARAQRAASDAGAAVGDVAKLFSFAVEEKLRCSQSGKVRIQHRHDNVLSLTIPTDELVNGDAVAAYQEVQQQKRLKADDVWAMTPCRVFFFRHGNVLFSVALHPVLCFWCCAGFFGPG